MIENKKNLYTFNAIDLRSCYTTISPYPRHEQDFNYRIYCDDTNKPIKKSMVSDAVAMKIVL